MKLYFVIFCLIAISHSLDVTDEIFQSNDCSGSPTLTLTRSIYLTQCNGTSIGPLQSSIKVVMPFLSGTIVFSTYSTKDCSGDAKAVVTTENMKCIQSNLLGSMRTRWTDVGAILFYIGIGIVGVVLVIVIVSILRRRRSFISIR